MSPNYLFLPVYGASTYDGTDLLALPVDAGLAEGLRQARRVLQDSLTEAKGGLPAIRAVDLQGGGQLLWRRFDRQGVGEEIARDPEGVLAQVLDGEMLVQVTAEGYARLDDQTDADDLSDSLMGPAILVSLVPASRLQLRIEFLDEDLDGTWFTTGTHLLPADLG